MNVLRKTTGQNNTAVKADDTEGSVRAVISTFNIIDRDGDVVLPSAIVDGTPVKLCSWGHKWGDLAVGKGILRNNGEQAIFEGKFFLSTEAGRECYQTVKELGDMQEWSWGFNVPKGGWYRGSVEGKSVRFISQTEPIEVSPVLIGSNPVTSTLDIKSPDVDGELEGEGTPPTDEIISEEKGETEVAPTTTTDDIVIEKEPDEVRDGLVANVLESLRSLMVNDLSSTDMEDLGGVGLLFQAAELVGWYAWRERMEQVELYATNPTESKRDELIAAFTKDLDTLEELGIVNLNKSTDAPGAEEPVPYGIGGDRVIERVKTFIERSRSLADLRAKEGRVLSEPNRDRLKNLRDALATAITDIEGLLSDTEPTPKAEKGTGRTDSDRDRFLRLSEKKAKTF